MPDINQPMMVIRKQLSADEVSDPRFRIVDGVVEQTTNGIDWFPSPANDVRHADAWRLPPVVADDPSCQAAANMSRFVQEWLEELLPILSIAGSGWALLSTIILLFLVLGPFALVVIMLDVAATLLGIGATAIGSAFTADVFDILTCIFKCNIGDDGQVSADQLEAINADVDDQIGGVAAVVLHLIFELVGEVGVSNWGAMGDAPADCDECDCGWCYVLDFAITDGGWTPYGSGQGHWQSGVGLVADNVVISVDRTIMQGTLPLGGTASIKSIAINYDWFAGEVNAGVTGLGGAFNDFAEGWADITMNNLADGNNQLVEVDVDVDAYNIFIDLQCSHGSFGGSATALLLTLRGIGDPPTFLEANGWVAC